MNDSTAPPDSNSEPKSTPTDSSQPPTSIFSVMGELAARHDAINLGQGAPDEDGPAEMLRIAAEGINGENTCNQYGPAWGMQNLREAIAADRAKRYGHQLGPETDIVVTVGATEALTSAILAFTSPGQEVIVLDPVYDSYPAAIAMAGAKMRAVPLKKRASSQKETCENSEAGDSVLGWQLDREAMAAAVTQRTRLLILNTPHNPTGYVASRDDLEFVADLARKHDLLVLTDEVYERLVFPDAEAAHGDSVTLSRPTENHAQAAIAHIPLATLPGMQERTVSVASAGKLFNVTGWKVGWAMGPANLIAQVAAVKQYLTFSGATPFQPAIAWALNNADEWSEQWRTTLRQRRDELAQGLRELGMNVLPSHGTYFLVSDIAPLVQSGKAGCHQTAEDWCKALPEIAGVATIPLGAFTHTEAGKRDTDTLVRWAFCKSSDTLQKAMTRLQKWHGSAG